MISKKVCMIGAFAVGKTSLVRRFVDNVYDDRYLTTVGVKIDRTVIEVDESSVNMLLWDLEGEDAFSELRLDYVRGASGLILVADGTRPETLDTAIALRERIQSAYRHVPSVLALNKVDLSDEWEFDEEKLEFLEKSDDWLIHRTSALAGSEVAEMFATLARRMIER